MEYIILIIVLLFLMYHYDYKGHVTGRKGWYLFVIAYCILLAGLRYRIGSDTITYATYNYTIYPDIFNYFSYDFSQEKFGRGYLFLNAIALTLSEDFVVMQFIVAIFFNTIFFRFLYRNTNKIFTASLIYFVFFYINLNTEVLRESCAIAVFLIGWEYYYKHKWVKYYLCCVVAILFHPSASVILVLPLFTLDIFKKVFSMSWVSVAIALGLFSLGTYLTANFFEVIRIIGVATVDNYADIYENSRYGTGVDLSIKGILVFLIRNIFYTFLMGWIVFKNKNRNFKVSSPYYVNSLLIIYLCYIYFSSLSTAIHILDRFNNYFGMIMIIVFADAIFQSINLLKCKYRLSYSLWMIVLLPLFYIRIYGLFQPGGDTQSAVIHKYYPYYSVFNKQLDKEREAMYYFSRHR